MMFLMLVLLLVKVVDLGMTGSFYLTCILVTLAGLLELLDLGLHPGKLASSLSKLLCLCYCPLLCCQLGIEIGLFPLEGLELESSSCVFVFLLGVCFVIFSELCVLVYHGGFVLLLSGTLSLNLLVCPDGLGRGLLWGGGSLNHDSMEVGGFCFGGGLIGGFSLCGSH